MCTIFISPVWPWNLTVCSSTSWDGFASPSLSELHMETTSERRLWAQRFPFRILSKKHPNGSSFGHKEPWFATWGSQLCWKQSLVFLLRWAAPAFPSFVFNFGVTCAAISNAAACGPSYKMCTLISFHIISAWNSPWPFLRIWTSEFLTIFRSPQQSPWAGEYGMIAGPHPRKLPQSCDTGSDQINPAYLLQSPIVDMLLAKPLFPLMIQESRIMSKHHMCWKNLVQVCHLWWRPVKWATDSKEV